VLLEVGAAPDLRARIAEIWGPEESADLIPVAHRQGGVVVSGLVQRPAAAMPGGRRAHLFVDGRTFSDRALVRAAERAYRTTVAPGMRPSLFLFLEVPPGAVDVNVHPAKAEVRFRDAIGVERAVEAGVRAALAQAQSAPPVGRSALQPVPDRSAGTAGAWLPEGVRPPAAEPTSAAPHGGEGETRAGEPQMSLFVAAAPRPAAGEALPPRSQPPEASLVSPVIWQLHNTYLLAETRGGLIIVDQHSAHERVLFEELMGSFENGGRDSQRLLFPLTLRLSPAEYGVVEELGGILAAAGFEVEPFGGRAVIVHAVPNPHPYFEPERVLRDMIAELAHGSPLVDAARNQHERIGLTFACKAAIKAGQRLFPDEMRELFDRLFATELPYHDIHGRPTVIRLGIDELHDRFRRHG
jgi:DNA mismatch repair protein MutL